MKVRVLMGVVLFLLALSPTSVFADVFENFDNYTPGAVSPAGVSSAGNPWTCSVDGNATCGTVSGYAQCFSPSTGVTYIGSGGGGTYSPPNVYSLYVSNAANCSVNGHSAFTGAHFVSLTAQLNVTKGGVTLALDRLSTVSTANIGVTVSLCGTQVFSAALNAEPSTFTALAESASGTIGVTCPLVFKLTPVHGASATTAKWQFDNIVVHNANLINANANLFLVSNSGTQGLVPGGIPQWYNITAYNNSYVELDNPGASPLTYSNLTAPDFHVNYGSASLLKVWVVPASYYVQIIPNVGTSNTVWLYPPSIVDTYTISIQDLSNSFGPGTQVVVAQGTRILSSGYTDAQNSYPIWTVPGSVTLTLTNAGAVYTTTLNFPSTSGTTIPVQILKYKQSGNCGTVCQVNYGAGFNAGGGSIVVTYTDSTGTTQSMVDQVWVKGPLGATLFYTKTFNAGPYSSITDTITCATDACNSTLASSIYVVITFANQYGSNTETLTVSGGSFFSTLFNIPQGLLGWDVIFPTSPTPLNFFSYIIILMSAASMGALAAKFGVVVIAVEAAMLSAVGWLPLVDGGSLFLIALGVLAFVSFLEQGR